MKGGKRYEQAKKGMDRFMMNLENLMVDFNVKDEDELFEKLIKDSETILCISCGKEIDWSKVIFIGGDPYCSECA